MKSILELVNINSRYHTKGEFGVEIEVEGKRLPTEFPDGSWRVERDGSLKTAEAWEYVMPKPLDIKGVRASLDVLGASYKAHGSVIDESIRAGVHVHMNVQKWDVNQMFTFMMCYFIVEELMVRWCGENREGNLFCLRSQDAEFILFQLHRAITDKNLKPLADENLRYASLNPCSLFKYGSLEFRSMRGTGDLNAIYKWVEIIKELRDSSSKFANPLEVITSMSGGGEDYFLRTLFPTNYVEFNKMDGYTKAIRSACRRVQMIAFTIDWEGLARPSKNPFKLEAF